MLQNPYDLIADEWYSGGRDQTYVKRVLPYVDRVLDGVPPRAKVLDLGCGVGDPIARYIVQRGFRVTGIDQSKEMLRIARSVVPEAELIHADMVDVEIKDTFAAAVAWDSVFHVERKHHSDIYRKLGNALEIGGRLLLSTGGSGPEEFASYDSEAEGFTSEMYGHTFFYSGYHPDVARRLLETAGFQIEMWEVDDPSSRGHIAAIVKKLNLQSARCG